MLMRLSVFVLWLLHFLPLGMLAALGNGIGSLLYYLAAERRHVGEVNLKLCFPQMSEAARNTLLRNHFRMFARGLLERSILWWSSAERISSLIRVEVRSRTSKIQRTASFFNRLPREREIPNASNSCESVHNRCSTKFEPSAASLRKPVNEPAGQRPTRLRLPAWTFTHPTWFVHPI